MVSRRYWRCRLPAAAQSVWGGSGSTTATSDYNTATNWSTPPGVAPTAPGTSATFANTGQSTVNVSAAVNPDSWTFATNAQSYSITGSAVTFNTGAGLVDNANAGQSIGIANSLNGAGALVLNGNSTLTLSNFNFYTGATTINSGATLALSGGAGISNSSVVSCKRYVRHFRFGHFLQSHHDARRHRNGSARRQRFGDYRRLDRIFRRNRRRRRSRNRRRHADTVRRQYLYQRDPDRYRRDAGAQRKRLDRQLAFTSVCPSARDCTFDISQTKAGTSVAGLFDPTGTGKVSLGSKTLTITDNVGPLRRRHSGWRDRRRRRRRS